MTFPECAHTLFFNYSADGLGYTLIISTIIWRYVFDLKLTQASQTLYHLINQKLEKD